jgi:RimJ/RimL family protein N-acetyltransferase
VLDFGYGVKLRRLAVIDGSKLFAWRNDPKIYRYTRQCDPLHPEKHESWLKEQAADPTLSMFGIVDKENQLLGVMGLTSIDLINRRAEFSCYIAPEYQRRGYGKKALLSLLAYGFLCLGLNLIWGETFDFNGAAELFKKVGMLGHGIRPQFYYREGRFIDAHLYGITRVEWDLLPDSQRACLRGI